MNYFFATTTKYLNLNILKNEKYLFFIIDNFLSLIYVGGIDISNVKIEFEE